MTRVAPAGDLDCVIVLRVPAEGLGRIGRGVLEDRVGVGAVQRMALKNGVGVTGGARRRGRGSGNRRNERAGDRKAERACGHLTSRRDLTGGAHGPNSR